MTCQLLNIWNCSEIRDKKMFGIPCFLCPSQCLCSVMSNLISLKELIIERGEVQRRSKKAINTCKTGWRIPLRYSRECCCWRRREEQTRRLGHLWDDCQIFLISITFTDNTWSTKPPTSNNYLEMASFPKLGLARLPLWDIPTFRTMQKANRTGLTGSWHGLADQAQKRVVTTSGATYIKTSPQLETAGWCNGLPGKPNKLGFLP